MTLQQNQTPSAEPQQTQQDPLPQYIAMPQGMQSQFQSQDDGIDFKDLWNALWAGKWLIIVITFVFAVTSIIYAIKQPNIYKATTVLAPAGDSGSGGLGKLAGQFGGLASIAGINLGGGEVDKTGMAIEILKTRAFIERFIEKHNLLIPLMAAENWDQVNDRLIFDEEIYNTQTKEWVREVKFPKTIKPSSWERYEAFSKIMSVAKDKETGLVTISIEYFAPEMAKKWLDLLVHDINELTRNNDKQDAQNSIDFLNQKVTEQNLPEDLKIMFYQLIQEQTKTIMLAEVAKEYVFKTIEPANAPDVKAKPKRALICLLGLFVGGMLSIALVLIRHAFNKR